jgi:hypothetical protein
MDTYRGVDTDLVNVYDVDTDVNNGHEQGYWNYTKVFLVTT